MPMQHEQAMLICAEQYAMTVPRYYFKCSNHYRVYSKYWYILALLKTLSIMPIVPNKLAPS